jgi:protein TonB
MPKPLRSDDPNPKSVQFAHFGVLDDGTRNKGAFATAAITNIVILVLLVIVGSVVKTVIAPKNDKKDLTFVKVEPPPEVKPPPPPPPVKLPPPPKLVERKIDLPKPIEPPPDIKPIEVPKPKPFVPAPAPPKAVTPPPAPVKVNLGTTAAAVPNHDAHPSAVRLGATDNPLKPLTGPAVANVNLGARGVPGMSASNTGNGPHAASVQLGNGCPNCQNLNGHDRGSARVEGVKLGVPGGTGPMNSTNFANRPVNVQLQTQQVPTQQVAHVAVSTAQSVPTTIYKPQAPYTEEARAQHIEGVVQVRIRVMPDGSVQVLGIVPGRSLGHGLDQSAEGAARGTRFKPARDAQGNPVTWEGIVQFQFQLS